MIAKVDNNNLYLYGIIWDGDGTYVTNEIRNIDGKHPILNVHINTKGGSVFDGNQIYGVLAKAKSKIHIYVDGLAASMGSILMLPGQKVFMTKSSLVMTHAPSGSIYGNAKDMRSGATLLDKLEKNFLEKYAGRTGKPEEDLKYLLDGDNWMDAEDCLALGLIDEIIPDVFTKSDIEALKEMKVAGSMKENDPFIMGLEVKKPKDNDKPKIETMKKQLMTALAFLAIASLNEESSDTAFVNAINDHVDGLKRDNDKKQQEIDALKKGINDEKDKVVTTLVEAAIKEGKINADKKDIFTKIGKDSGVEALTSVLDVTPRKSIASAMSGKKQTTEEMSWNEWQKKDPRGLEKMQTENPEAFNAIYKEKFGREFSA